MRPPPVRPALTLAALCLLAAPARAQMTIGAVRLSLGASRARTLTELRAQGQVDSATGPNAGDQWMILTREGPPHRFLGWVHFRGGRLDAMGRDWTPGPERASVPAYARALVTALLATPAAERASCRIVDRSSAQPGEELRSVGIRCGRRTVSVTAVQTDEREDALVAESVEAGSGTD